MWCYRVNAAIASPMTRPRMTSNVAAATDLVEIKALLPVFDVDVAHRVEDVVCEK